MGHAAWLEDKMKWAARARDADGITLMQRHRLVDLQLRIVDGKALECAEALQGDLWNAVVPVGNLHARGLQGHLGVNQADVACSFAAQSELRAAEAQVGVLWWVDGRA